jgi:hypothetical protein
MRGNEMIVNTMLNNTTEIIAQANDLTKGKQYDSDQIRNLLILQQNNLLTAIAVNTAVIADRLTEISCNIDTRRKK